MTSTDISPWTGITRPESGFNVLRVDPGHPHDFFWGKNVGGDSLLLLEIDKELSGFLEGKSVELRGVKTDLIFHAATSQYFFLICLQKKEDADIFYRLCFDLVQRTKEINTLKVALEVILTRLKRWKSFLSGSKKYLLSAKEVRGLYAELLFMRECLATVDEQLTVLEGWQGPLDGPHDFILGDYAVEVKSVAGSQKDSVRISSENQLVTHLDDLYLKVFFLAEFQDCKKGESLNRVVEKVRGAIVDSDHVDVFDARLYASGYIEVAEYDSPCFSVTMQKTFKLADNFPRIIPDDLQEGLSNVSYDLDLKNLDEYACELPVKEG